MQQVQVQFRQRLEVAIQQRSLLLNDFSILVAEALFPVLRFRLCYV
ncbi:hypothetical protein [Nostoc sp.]